MQLLWKIFLSLGIVFAFVAFVMALQELVYKSPRYEDYFTKSQSAPIATQEACEKIGGKWYVQGEAPFRPQPVLPQEAETPPQETKSNQSTGWCDQNFSKQQAFDSVRKDHGRNSFIALVLLGTLALVGGVANLYGSRTYSPVGGGFAVGGVILMIISTARYWEWMNEVGRVFLLGGILLLLIATGVFLPKLIARLKSR